jgi:hypothetical protein
MKYLTRLITQGWHVAQQCLRDRQPVDNLSKPELY